MRLSSLLVVCLLLLACDRDDSEAISSSRPPRLQSSTPSTEPSAPRCAPGKATLEPVGRPISATVVLARDGRRDLAFVADPDERAVVAVDLDAGEELARIDLDSAVEQLLLAPDGRLLASLADRDRIVVLGWEGAEGLVARCSRRLVGEPSGMAMSEDGRQLLVASRWTAELHVLDGQTLAPRRVVPLPRDPYAVALVGEGVDGKQALVTHVVGGVVSAVDLESGRVHQIDASRHDQKSEPMSHKPMPFFAEEPWGKPRPQRQGRSIRAHRIATQAYALAVDRDGRAFVPASLADGSPAPRHSGYGGGSGSLRTHAGVTLVVDAAADKIDVPRGGLPIRDECQLPRGVALDEEAGWLLVACRGVDAVHVYQQRRKPVGRLLARVGVPPGPSGVAFDPERRRVVAWSSFSGALSVFPLPRPQPMRELTKGYLTPELPSRLVRLERFRPRDEQVLLGRKIFHEAGPRRRIAFDGRACASCHPDGRDDGVTWSTAEGPRQTPILMARLDGTAPFGWNGRKDALKAHLARTLARLRGTGLDETEVDAVVAYLASMDPPAASVAADVAASVAADVAADHDEPLARGRALFESDEVGCAGCHPGSETTDGLTHAFSSSNRADLVPDFDTPSLRFVAQSAPYFHDGRYPDLDALLSDPDSEMGHSADLDAGDRRALRLYLETL